MENTYSLLTEVGDGGKLESWLIMDAIVMPWKKVNSMLSACLECSNISPLLTLQDDI